MRRREAVGALACAAIWSSGCASRAPAPPKAPVNLETFGMLPIKEWEPTGSTAPFSLLLLTEQPSRPFVTPSNAAGLGAAIGNSIRSGQASRRRQLAQALEGINFGARLTLADAVSSLVERRSLPVVAVGDIALAREVWADTFKTLPQAHDAIIDLQIHGAGFYPWNELGFVPYLSVSSRILDTKRPSEPVEHFSYEINHGKSEGDPRFFACPPGLVVKDLAGFANDPASIKRQLQDLYGLVAAHIVADIQQLLPTRLRGVG